MSLSKEVIDIISERHITQCADYTQLLVPITSQKSDHASVVFDRDVAFYRPKVPKVRFPAKCFWGPLERPDGFPGMISLLFHSLGIVLCINECCALVNILSAVMTTFSIECNHPFKKTVIWWVWGVLNTFWCVKGWTKIYLIKGVLTVHGLWSMCHLVQGFGTRLQFLLEGCFWTTLKLPHCPFLKIRYKTR